MTDNLPATQKEHRPDFQAGASPKALVPTTFDETWRMGVAIHRAGIAPNGCDTPEKIMIILMHGLEVGLSPMQALQSIALVNNRPVVWGDGALALVRASGLLVGMHEENTTTTAICTVERKGEPPQTRSFTWQMAQKAGLTDKKGPWQTYPGRMLQMRARAWALRDIFPDVLKGLSVREEVEDYDVPRRGQQGPAGAFQPERVPPIPPKPGNSPTGQLGANLGPSTAISRGTDEPRSAELRPGDIDYGPSIDPKTGEVTEPDRPTMRPRPTPPRPSKGAPTASRPSSTANAQSATDDNGLPWQLRIVPALEHAPDFGTASITDLLPYQSQLFNVAQSKEEANQIFAHHLRDHYRKVPHPANVDTLKKAWDQQMERLR